MLKAPHPIWLTIWGLLLHLFVIIARDTQFGYSVINKKPTFLFSISWFLTLLWLTIDIFYGRVILFISVDILYLAGLHHSNYSLF